MWTCQPLLSQPSPLSCVCSKDKLALYWFPFSLNELITCMMFALSCASLCVLRLSSAHAHARTHTHTHTLKHTHTQTHTQTHTHTSTVNTHNVNMLSKHGADAVLGPTNNTVLHHDLMRKINPSSVFTVDCFPSGSNRKANRP